MAQKLVVEMVDDIDGTPATQTVPFALDGVTYEVDLSDENAASLRDELARFIEVAQRTGGRKIRLATGQSAASASQTDRERSRQVRVWAQANGYEVSNRGRLSAEILDAYEKAQATATEPIGSPGKRGSRKKVAAAKR
ncbi:Lsr2 family protein [Amycolatopsis sp. NPDC059657]|uniref:histone-like nucleoid-structuring protein Lsr2 n=1 Tax=Amycolatopsis sp. NPDC059657 TaxID=3346899 RepID=UPI00366DCF30